VLAVIDIATNPIEPSSTPLGSSRDNPLPMGQSLVTTEGIEITVISLISGEDAWEVINKANWLFNESPGSGMKYLIITLKVRNLSSKVEPEDIYSWDFHVVGSSNKAFRDSDQPVVLPDTGNLKDLNASLYHGGEDIGSCDFYVPEGETDLILVWEPLFVGSARYFTIE